MATFPAQDSRLFQCGTCSQSYSRVDHLARHVRSHTREKPYQCETCHKQFSRVDLLKRHALLHTSTTKEAQNKRRRTSTNSSTPFRVSKACEACAEHHLKCEDEKPCRRCSKKNIACIVAPKQLINDPGEPPASSLESNTDSRSQHDQQALMNEESLQSALSSLDERDPFDSLLSDTTPNQVQLPVPPRPHPGSQDPVNVESHQSHNRSVDIPTVMDFLPVAFADFPSGTLTPSGLLGFSGEIDLDFSAIDLSFLDTYNTRVPFEVENPNSLIAPSNVHATIQNPSKQGEDTETSSPGSFLQPSIWRFVPVPGVHAYAEQGDLSLPEQDRIVGTPESFADMSRRATIERLDSVSRDKILAIVLSQVKSNILPALSAFPSVKLLDKLIQFFLAGPVPTASSWIHTASFRPKKARPELLLAMAAAGAVLTPDRSLRKLGFAIEEVIRNHIPAAFESDNTLVRDLEMSQAFMLQLEIGLWSGSSRKMEISESHQQPLLTMLRRGGRFRRYNYPPPVYRPEDEGPTLQKKWHAWIEQESFKRLVYHLLSHDAQVSISRLVNPLVSYSELDLPLPESQALWSAISAVEWKMQLQARFENSMTSIPSLTDCVANPNLLETGQGVSNFDLSCSSFLYAMWGIVWEYRKQTLLTYMRPMKTSLWDGRFATVTQYQELLKVFDHYRIYHGDKSTMLLEVILMHLHMSLEEIQLFCGLEGHEDISRIHASIKEWAATQEARLAVWHAGQVVRAAKGLPPMQLRDFYAISLFHASLTFWAYGIASRLVFQHNSPIGHGNVRQVVCIDDEESAATYRFISLNTGCPALRGLGPDMSMPHLSDATGVMSRMIDMIKHGHEEPSIPNSPLVENLLGVMGRLRSLRLSETGLAL